MTHRKGEKTDYPISEWGPYLSERQWGTVREDYSQDGNAWNYFPFEHAHFRTYQWGEDGLGGISDRFQNLCFGLALWNGKDPILKERLFGLHNGEGNHGEDVKELYYYLDNVPDHSYMEFLYKYPQAKFPYEKLKEENAKLSRLEPEYEILDTGVFNSSRYFDVKITYAKHTDTDIFIRIEITNRHNRVAELTVMPTLWFSKQTFSKEFLAESQIFYSRPGAVKATHEMLGDYYFYFDPATDMLFTDNRTNTEKITGVPADIFVKDAFNEDVIKGLNLEALRERKRGTKFASSQKLRISGGATRTIYCRLSSQELADPFEAGFQNIFPYRKSEADTFYRSILPKNIDEELFTIQRQALAGILWSKQFYSFDVEKWLTVSDGITETLPHRLQGRNGEWLHLKNQDIISMPDKWEYPWYAAWDLAFQCISLGMVDPGFAKNQLLLIMREWYMKPDGQLPAYEWNFSDVNPPVHAFAALEVYNMEKEKTGNGDIVFLKKIFQKLLINFTWWINRKDRKGNNLFQGGFLGLDNIGVFNRSFYEEDMHLEQADGTSWMGAYALHMLDIALEIAQHDESFEDTATKFFDHFVLIAEALNEHHLWNEEDKFFYDVLTLPDAEPIPLRIKSIVGLTSLFAVSSIKRKVLDALPDFSHRTSWFESYRKRFHKFWPMEDREDGSEILLSLVRKERLGYLLQRLLDESEFLSAGGIRALSKYHEANPYSVTLQGNEYNISYDPGDSTSQIFGGNSNWRGPVWIPINYLIIQSVRRFGRFYGDTFKTECPIGSGNEMNLRQVADELTRRVVSLFIRKEGEGRKLNGKYNWFYNLPENRDLILFFEYFHGDSGAGLGANHQTGWTALVANLISQMAEDAGEGELVTPAYNEPYETV